MIAPFSADPAPRGRLLVAKPWIQASILIVLFGFLVLGGLVAQPLRG